MSDLDNKFAAAVKTVQTAEGDFKPSDALKLKLYALYKQASAGNAANGKKPSAFNLIAKAKYKAWSELGNMSQDEAKQQYIDAIAELEAKLKPQA